MKIELVLNILVYKNWIYSFLKIKKLASSSKKIKIDFLKTGFLPNITLIYSVGGELEVSRMCYSRSSRSFRPRLFR
jgi:hypothetical protein